MYNGTSSLSKESIVTPGNGNISIEAHKMRLTALYNETPTPREAKHKGQYSHRSDHPDKGDHSNRSNYSQNFTLRQLLLQQDAETEDDDDEDSVRLPKLNVVRIEVR